MAKYAKRSFRVGDYYLGQRAKSPAWYRCWLDGRKLQKISLGTADFEEAKVLLKEWFLEHCKPKETNNADVLLRDVLERYWLQHGQNVTSAKRVRFSLDAWAEHYGAATVLEATAIHRQEAFHTWLRAKGHKSGTVRRTLCDGRSALNRAWRRGDLTAQPNVLMVSAGKEEPKGRPLKVEEMARLYQAAGPHLQTFIKWMIGTAARPDAILDLDYSQVRDGLIYLLPEGREQTKKVRPIVRVPMFLAVRPVDGPVVHLNGTGLGSIRTAWRAARRRAGLDDKVQPYSLRKTCAMWMMRQGVPPHQVGMQLGHKLLGITGVYTEYSPDYLLEACVALESLWAAVCETIAGQQHASALPSDQRYPIVRHGTHP